MLSKSLKRLTEGSNGVLPPYAWPGGYPLYYVNDHNDVLCPACANEHEDFDETIVAYDINGEDDGMYCDHCSVRIESAYAEDEVSA